jgi:hypothetical protein
MFKRGDKIKNKNGITGKVSLCYRGVAHASVRDCVMVMLTVIRGGSNSATWFADECSLATPEDVQRDEATKFIAGLNPTGDHTPELMANRDKWESAKELPEQLTDAAAFGAHFGAGDKTQELVARTEITTQEATEALQAHAKLSGTQTGRATSDTPNAIEVAVVAAGSSRLPANTRTIIKDVDGPLCSLPKWLEISLFQANPHVPESLRRRTLAVFLKEVSEPITEAIGTWDKDKLSRIYDEHKGYLRR